MRRRKMNKRGITPVIAVILLMMMTVAAAGAAFFWFVRIQGELQSGGETYAAELSQTINSNLEISVVDYISGDLELIFRNIGGVDIEVNTGADSPTTALILQEGTGTVICQTYLGSANADCTTGCSNDIEVGETQRMVIDLAGDCSLSSYSEDELILFDLDFSGDVGTGGDFKI